MCKSRSTAPRAAAVIALGGWLAMLVATALIPPGRRRLAGAGLAVAGLGVAAWRVSPAPGPGSFVAIEAVLLLLGLACVVRASVQAMAQRTGAPPPADAEPRPLPTSAAADRAALVVLAFAAAAAALGPHLAVVFLAAGLASVAAQWLTRSDFRGVVPVAPLLTILSLGPAYGLLAEVAGDGGLWMRSLNDLPISPAAEVLLASLLLVAGWSVTGLWPQPRDFPAGLAAPAALLLLGRFALPVLPGGIDHWRPLAFPLLGIGLVQAAAAGRWRALATGGAVLGLATATDPGTAGAWLLGLAALLLEAERLPGARAPRPLRAAAGGAAVIAGGWGGLLVLEGGLRVEVVYSAFTALTIGGALVLRRAR